MLLALVTKEILALRRDLHGLGAIFLLPVVFIVVMSMALKDVYNPPINKLNWALLDSDNSAQSQQLSERWQLDKGAPEKLPAQWRQALSRGEIKYVLHLEAGAAANLLNTEAEAGPGFVLLAEPGLDQSILKALHAQLMAAVLQLKAEALLAKLPENFSTLNFGDDSVDDFGAESAPAIAAKSTENGDAATKQKVYSVQSIARAERINSTARLTSVQHNVPAWLIFGMFFVVTSIAGLFVEERSCGALKRLHSLGVNPALLLLGKVIPFLGVNALQAALMLAVGIFFMPLLGGEGLSLVGVNVVALVSMLLCISLAAISLALLVATLVRSQAQASAVGPMLNILMAAIGGIMVPTFVMPAEMQTLAQLSPMNWALNGLLDVILRSANVAAVQWQLLKLLSFAGACIAFAYLFLRIKKT